jgi:hypothetical protein
LKKLSLFPTVLVANEGVTGQSTMGQRPKMRIVRTMGIPMDAENRTLTRLDWTRSLESS